MIVAAWFMLVSFVILVGFLTLALTFHHWYKQKKVAAKVQEIAQDSHPS